MTDSVDRNVVKRIIRDLYNGFDWGNTSQGLEYWKNVVLELERLVPGKEPMKFSIVWSSRENSFILREKVANKWRQIGRFSNKREAEIAQEGYYG